MPGMSKSYARHSRSQRSVAARVVLPLVAREAKKRPGARVIELGCGPGTLLAELRRLGVEALGTDRDAFTVRLAQRAGFDARVVDFRRVPAALRGRFGVVFANEALHWTSPAPARFVRATWHYRFLPERLAPEFERWGRARVVEGLRGAARTLAPGGIAVLQFGARGQLSELFAAFERVFASPRLRRLRGKIWDPVYYPDRRELPGLAARAGLRIETLRAWSEPLSERGARELVASVRAWTERGFLARLSSRERATFYTLLRRELDGSGTRRIRWRRCLVVARVI